MNIKILDGGLSTFLINDFNHPELSLDPLWACRLLQTHPQDVEDAHMRFLESGSDIIQTCTYQLSVDGLKKYEGMDEKMSERMMERAVKMAMDVRDEFWNKWLKTDTQGIRHRPIVTVCLGPYATYLHDRSEYNPSYIQELSVEQLKAYHRIQLQALTCIQERLNCQRILVSFETQTTVKESLCVVEVMTGEFMEMDAWITFTFKDGDVTWNDEKIDDVINKILSHNNKHKKNNNNNTNNNKNINNNSNSTKNNNSKNKNNKKNNNINNNNNNKNNNNSNIVGVGINCTHPKYIKSLLYKLCTCLYEANEMESLAVIIYPNPHNVWHEEQQKWVRLDGAVEWSGYFVEWIQVYQSFREKKANNKNSILDNNINNNGENNNNNKNVNKSNNKDIKNNNNGLRGCLVLGGCCLVGPEDIKQLKSVTSNYLNKEIDR